jgi:CRISPR/Cas system CMR subunit Cmr6 (Cas7 group RAMP superfamily)
MDEILNKKKQQRIRELVNNFNNNFRQTRTNYARLILNVSKSRNKLKVKKNLVFNRLFYNTNLVLVTAIYLQ